MTRERSEYYKQYYLENKDKITARKSVSSKAWREQNKENLQQKGKEYYLKNKEKVLERTNKNKREKYRANPQLELTKQKEWKQNNLEKYLLQSARARAKKYGIPMDIVAEDIVIPTTCPYLGIQLQPFSEWASPSLDKIVPELGYVKGNVQVISTLANTMKSKSSLEQLITFAENVLKLHKEEDTL